MVTANTDGSADFLAARSHPPARPISTDKLPGHWVLASAGKRVLRPGGLELTR